MTPRLLAIAYACEPGRGSEWGVGWNFVRELSMTQPVWVIVHADNRRVLEPHLRDNPPIMPIYVSYVACPWWCEWLRHIGYAGFNVWYYLWTFFAAAEARRLHRLHEFDLVHHVSLVRWWMPSPGATLARHGVKFIFGPVTGGEIVPPNFRGTMPAWMRFTDACRWIARTVFSFDPLLRRTIRAADLCIAATEQTLRRMERFKPRRAIVMPLAATTGNGIMSDAMAVRENRRAGERFRIVSVGGLNNWRGIDITIRAIAKCGHSDVEYHHYCEGAARERCEQLARSLGVADRVFFHPDQPHAENLKSLALADVLVHMVLRDSQGLLCEAMVMGVPIITIDHLTPAAIVSRSCAHSCAMTAQTTPESLVDELAQVISRFRTDAALLARMSVAGRDHARRFTAEQRGLELRELHRRVLASHEDACADPRPATPQRASA